MSGGEVDERWGSRVHMNRVKLPHCPCTDAFLRSQFFVGFSTSPHCFMLLR